MKPLELWVEGVNSFTDRQTIDFTRLGNLFCITGKTGSGKSTILDCMILALYGKGSKKGNLIGDYVNLKCNAAAVSFSFSEEGKTYRVERSFYRDKNKPAKAFLYEDGRLAAAAAGEVNDRIQGIIGLRREDFTQITVLEQGEFDRFIAADKSRRSETVGNLFKLNRYKDIYTKLSARKKVLEAEREQLLKRLEPFAYAETAVLRELTGRLQAAKDGIAAVTASQSAVEEELRLSAAQKTLAEEEARREGERRRLTAELKRAEELRLDLRQRLEAAEAKAAGAQKLRAETEIKRELAAKIEYFIAASGIDALQTKRRQFLAEYKQLTADRDLLAARIEAKRRQAEICASQLKAALYEVAAVIEIEDEAEKDLPLLLNSWQERSDEIARLKAGLTEANLGLTNLLTEEEEARRLTAEAVAVAAATKRELSAAETKLKELKIQRERVLKEEAAARLRAELKKGDICPVCGAVVGTTTAAAVILPSNRQEQETEALVSELNERLMKAERLNASAVEKLRQTGKRIEEKRAAINAESAKLQRLTLGLRRDADPVPLLKKAAALKEGRDENGLKSLEQELQLVEAKLAGTVKEGRGLKAQIEAAETQRRNLCGEEEAAAKLARLKAEIAAGLGSIEAAERALTAAREEAQRNQSLCSQLSGGLKALGQARTIPFDEARYQELTAEKNRLQQSLVQLTAEQSAGAERLQRLKGDMEQKRVLEREIKQNTSALDDLSLLMPLFTGDKFLEFVAEEYILQFTAAASEIMASMTGGKYTLCYDGAGGSFTVADYLSGNEIRKLSTLSGGETFLASLSIAMAISRQRASSNNYEFFFLDEGFGTLDEDALATVAGGLYELSRETMVGVITHRSELSEVLPERITITEANAVSGSKISNGN